MIAAWSLSVAVALGLGWWAALQATRPPVADTPAVQAVTVAVRQGTVSVEQAYGINADWPTHPLGVNGSGGTLTSLGLAASGSLIHEGDTLYSVDLIPVVAVEGSVPAFRDLGPGSHGADVEQLQKFLVHKGYLKGSVDGQFGSATTHAVSRWNADLGAGASSIVPLGRIVFLPSLPANLAPAPDLRIGMRVSPGQELLVGADAPPHFSFRVLPEAVSRTTPGMAVRIDASGEHWSGEVDHLEAAMDETGGMIAVLRPAKGSDTICGMECAQVLRLGGKAVLPGTLVLVPETSGPEIPTAAITTDASGSTFVTLESGKRKAVRILASSDGRSVVDGIQIGDRIVVVGASARQ
jgi:peptidoglycan hydrolase-like protein with peptidoglycan-binding domain